MKSIKVKLKSKSYIIYIEKDGKYSICKFIKEKFNGKKVVIITDHTVNALYGEELRRAIENEGNPVFIVAIKPGEESKSMDSLNNIYFEFSKIKLSREDLILTLGGGVVGDLGGFAASTYLRGVPYIQIPTTLLAQVDSSIGGKVAIDLPWGKNLVGSFYHPEAVFIDGNFLKTLSPKVLHDGLAEVIKYGCIKDRSIIMKLLSFKDDDELLEELEYVIYNCCNIKRIIVEMDEMDFGERMLLNFGHTLGHAIEKYFNYQKYTHGEAVAMGMLEMVKRGEEYKITEPGTSLILEEVLKKYKLPFTLPIMNKFDLLETIGLDKKNNNNKINIIMLSELGEGFIKKIGLDELENYI